ncbi:hypothetical protein C100_12610 [Sphingobium sp. C100]|nr:hypothetical protein C100_12610 [Sphingobium sp. C100]
MKISGGQQPRNLENHIGRVLVAFDKSFFLASASISLMVPGAAFAQAASDGGHNGFGTGEIVVTANKREQKLSDVGVTATVISGDSLQQQGISSLEEVANHVPSLSYAAAPNGTPVYTLRGVGFYESSISAYPSVSIYVDEVPLPFPILSNHITFDIERLEVLKGPQGTLFGQNSTGGAINYIAAKPTDTFRAGGSLSYARFDQVDAEAFVSGPLGEKLKARLAGRVELGDAWQRSESRPGDRNGKTRNYMGRFLLAFEPSTSVRFLLTVNGWKDKSEPLAPQHIALQFQNEALGVPSGFPVGAFRPAQELEAPFSSLGPRDADWSTRSTLFDHKTPFADNDMLQASLRADIDVGDFGTLTSLTAYTKFNQRQGNDYDGLPINGLDAPLILGDIKTFTQELRFANDPRNPFRFVIGGNYEKDKVYQQLNTNFAESSAFIGYGTVFGTPITINTIDNNQAMRAYAFFGNVEYDVVDALTLKAGVRYTNARDRATTCQTDIQGPQYYLGNLFAVFSPLLGGPARGPYQPRECFALNLDPETFLPVVDYLPFAALGEYRDTLSEDNVSWRIGADFKASPDILLYANVSKGYKAGSYPVTAATTFGQAVPAKQESVFAVEGGIKSSLLDRRLQLNVAGFYYDYRDKQLRTKLNDPTFGQLDVLRNIPKSSIKGVEVELTARPSDRLTVNAAYTFLDAKVDRFVGTNAGGETGIDFAGTPIPYTPRHQVSVGFNYDQPLSGDLVLFSGASINHRSGTIATLGGNTNPSTVFAKAVPCVYCIDGYTTIDAQLGIRDESQGWRAFVWGKNIGNEYYWTNVAAGYDTVARFVGRPTSYGVTVGYSFR